MPFDGELFSQRAIFATMFVTTVYRRHNRRHASVESLDNWTKPTNQT
jgi:hypothetical protein